MPDKAATPRTSVGIDPNFFEVCSPTMDTYSILRLSRSNALNLLKFATLALHPLVDRFHFCYQHSCLLRLTLSVLGNLFSKRRTSDAMPSESIVSICLLLWG